jgi:hypothetical protein
MAYYAAKYFSKTNKELCAYVGSMLCSVVPGFKKSVEKSLNEICVRPRFVSLPSQANEINIVISNAPQLGWPSILVVFGYCIILLFKPDEGYASYDRYISYSISQLQAEVNIVIPSNKLVIPFDATQAKSVTTMLGSHDLRHTVMTFLMNNSNHPDSQIRKVCIYLMNKLS